MREIRTEIEIDAPPAAVWDVLADFAAYGEWNPHVTSVRGVPREGAEIEIEVRSTGGRRRRITAEITACDPPRTLRWVGTALSPWLFRGEHTFELHPLDADRTGFRNRERVSGVLAPFVASGEARRRYEAMNEALADRVERRLSAGAA